MPKRLLLITLALIIVVSALPAWAETITYTVQPGDNLYRIGLRYGVDWRTLMTANGLRSPFIYAGQRLIIPGATLTGTPLPAPAGLTATPAPLVLADSPTATAAADTSSSAAGGTSSSAAGAYTVVAGDSLWSIARRFGLTAYQLMALNPAILPNRIYPGQVLRLPATAGASAASSTPPLASETPAPGLSTTPLDLTGLPQVSARAREIYQQGLARGNNPRAFSKVGDCNSTLPKFLADFDAPGAYQLGGPYAYLQETVTNFAGSFARPSQAVHIGYSALDVLSPEWADPRACQAGESPLPCEYRLWRPSLAFISLGTNDYGHGLDLFEKNVRAVIEQSIALGVVPIVGTKADNLEGYGRYNALLRQLASEYDVPLWDYGQVAQRLPGGGLYADGYHLLDGPSRFTDPANISGAWAWRNLTALEALDLVWRGVR